MTRIEKTGKKNSRRAGSVRRRCGRRRRRRLQFLDPRFGQRFPQGVFQRLAQLQRVILFVDLDIPVDARTANYFALEQLQRRIVANAARSAEGTEIAEVARGRSALEAARAAATGGPAKARRAAATAPGPAPT